MEEKQVTFKKDERLKTVFSALFHNGIRVDVSTWGVTIWDNKAKRWIVDYSSRGVGDEIHVSQWIKRLRKNPGCALRFSAFYPESNKPKRRKKKT